MSNNNIILIVGLIVVVAVLVFRQSASTRKQANQLLNIQPGPIRHEALPEPLVERIRRLEVVFAEVYRHTHAEWLDGFQRDAVPEREVAVWESMASAFTNFTRSRSLTIDARQEAFGLLLTRSAVDEKSALADAKLRHLSRADAQELLSLYSADARPVLIEKR